MGGFSDFVMGVRVANMIVGLIRDYRASGADFDIGTVLPSFLSGLGQIAGIKELTPENVAVLTPLFSELWNGIRGLREPSAGKL